jgi:hypothetical protein
MNNTWNNLGKNTKMDLNQFVLEYFEILDSLLPLQEAISQTLYNWRVKAVVLGLSCIILYNQVLFLLIFLVEYFSQWPPLVIL